MKKTMITLWVMIGCLAMNAQPTAELRSHRNPAVEGLMEYARSLDYYVRYAYDDYSGQNILLSLYPSNDNAEKTHLLLDSIRHTCEVLSVSAKESNMWELHQEGKDTIYYAITLSNSQDAAEKITFKYRSIARETTSPNDLIGFGDFVYNYHTANIQRTRNASYDLPAYWKTIKEVFSRDGVVVHAFTISNDSTHNFSKDVYGGLVTNDPERWSSEQTGLLCMTTSMERANNIVDDIIKATWAHVDQHPHIWYGISESNRFGIPAYIAGHSLITLDYNRFLIDLYEDTDQKSGTPRYYIMAREIQGSPFFPKDWQTLKSYKNGKYEYYDTPDTKY